jgi:hypothetical protein
LEPFVIDIQWYSTMPQIYIDIPRNYAFSKYPVSFGYKAVQLVMFEAAIRNEQTAELKCFSSGTNTDIIDISEYDMRQLIGKMTRIV